MSAILYFVHSFSLSVFEAIQVPDSDNDKSNDDDDDDDDDEVFVIKSTKKRQATSSHTPPPTTRARKSLHLNITPVPCLQPQSLVTKSGIKSKNLCTKPSSSSSPLSSLDSPSQNQISTSDDDVFSPGSAGFPTKPVRWGKNLNKEIVECLVVMESCYKVKESITPLNLINLFIIFIFK